MAGGGACGAGCVLLAVPSERPRQCHAGRGRLRRRAKGSGCLPPWPNGACGTHAVRAEAGQGVLKGHARVVRMSGSWAHSSGSLAAFISARVTFISVRHTEHVRDMWWMHAWANPNRARTRARRDRSGLLARRPQAVELRLGPRLQGVRCRVLCHGLWRKQGGMRRRDLRGDGEASLAAPNEAHLRHRLPHHLVYSEVDSETVSGTVSTTP